MEDMDHFSQSEYEKIASVLKRDRELRVMEEARIRQLKQELLCLRKRAALRPGLDPLRNCARCLTELGRILNRGALCPSCLKKVCKDCRHYGDENHEWLCIYCFKQMQLKAISGEWMQEFSKQSVRSCAKDPPRDQLRKALHESQRKGLLDLEAPEQKKSPSNIEIPPQKPPRSFQYEQSRETVEHEGKIDCIGTEMKENATEISSSGNVDNPSSEKNHNQSPKLLPRVSPWNGIDPEPTIPMRVDKSRSFGSVQQQDLSDQYSYRERQSSDEGHCTLGFRSRSTSSEVIDESETLAPVPLPRKRLSPLKKQQAIPEPSPVEKQQSSVDTVDSGVFSPGLKMGSSIDTIAPPSPLIASRLSSVEQEIVDSTPNRPSPFVQQCTSESSSGENEEEHEAPPAPRSSDVLFRKVTLKKRNFGAKAIKEKSSPAVMSSDVNPVPHSGLNYSFFHNFSNTFYPTNPKSKLIHSNANISSSRTIQSPPLGSGLKNKFNNKSMVTLANSQTCMETCKGKSFPSNPEALCDGNKKSQKGVLHVSEEESVVLDAEVKLRSSVKEHRLKQKRDYQHYKRKKCTKNENHEDIQNLTSSDKLHKREYCSIHGTYNKRKHFKLKSASAQNRYDSPNMLFRSSSLPNRRTFTYNWLQTWLWKCHSLEDWLWYLEEQPCEARDFSQINILPDDYKLVYVSSSSDSEESSDTLIHHFNQNYRIESKPQFSVNSFTKTNCNVSYFEDSDWEIESVDSDDSDLFLTMNKNENFIQVNEGNNFFIRRNLYDDKKWDHELKQMCSLKNEKSKCRSLDSIDVVHDGEIQISTFNQNKSSYIFYDTEAHSNLTLCSLFKVLNQRNLFQFFKERFYLLTVAETERKSKLFGQLDINTSVFRERKNSHLPSSSNPEFQIDKNISIISLSDKLISKIDLPPVTEKVASLLLSIIHSSLTDDKCTLFFKLMSNIFCDNFHNRSSGSFDFRNSLELFPLSIYNINVSEYPAIEMKNILLQFVVENCKFINDKNIRNEIVFLDEKFDFLLRSDRKNPPTNEACNSFILSNIESRNLLLKRLILLSIKRNVKGFDITCNSCHAAIAENKCDNLSSRNTISLLCNKNINDSENQFKYQSFFLTTYNVVLFLNSDILFFRNNSCNAERCGGKIYSQRFGEFCNPSWRRDCYEKVGNLLHPGDANAFHYVAFPLSSGNPTNRGNDKSVTGWGKQRCSIAVATRRVIDLNLRALECGREVLDVADLTTLLGWVAITGVSSSAKHGGIASIVNAFFYHAPPVASKPEADYLLRLTRSDPCLLFQRSPHASGVARMIALKSEDTAVSGFVKTDNVNKFCLDETRKGVDAMQLEDEESSVQNIPQSCKLVSHVHDAFKLCDSLQTDTPRTNTDRAAKSSTRTCGESVNKLNLPFNIKEFDVNRISNVFPQNCDSVSKNSFNQVHEVEESLKKFDTEILSCVRNIFFDEFTCESSSFYSEELCVSIPSAISDGSDTFERVDCHCNKPCDVPSSPSVVDATRSLADEGEILSSGDELDKLESDTDSQDTVIEGEAYKRIRSVAIKEKILHANEELFGVNIKDTFCDTSDSNKFTDIQVTEVSSENSYNIKDVPKKPFQSLFLQESTNFNKKLSLFSNLEDINSAQNVFSVPKHFQPFKQTDISAFHPVSSLSFIENKIHEVESSDCSGNLNEIPSSSYKAPFCENICSSESSDNGSDGEEVILSDTSTSSDEATYIAPSAAFRYYNHPMSYRLHTIVEESCEESERSSRSSGPTSRANSDFEYFDKTQLSSKSPRKIFRKSVSDNTIIGHPKNGKSSASYAVLATSRLEKYFKSGLLDGEVSYPEDDMTDESGGISSDDEISAALIKEKLKNQFTNNKTISEKLSKKTSTVANEKLGMCSKTLTNFQSVSHSHKHYASNLETRKQSSDRKIFVCSSSYKTTCRAESATSDMKQNKSTEPVSDDDAKYIMNHLMQHISNNTDVQPEISPEVKDVSPMLKILESEIARLMLTVSPASLSTGDPSSSCSSTIGSNNSDYGSDTLESAEDSTSDEDINTREVSENRTLLDLPSQNESPSTSGNNNNSLVENNSAEISVSDTAVSEETLYICKQLMASLKKIADATDGTTASDDCCSSSEDHSAKQYITDQIVSLMQTVNASHNNSPLLRTLTSNVSSIIQIDSDVSHDRSDSDSPPLNDDKRDHPKSKTPSESGSETTISASISIPSYDDSDRTPTESEISHEMDELYALLESNGTHQDVMSSAKFSYDLDTNGLEKMESPRNMDSPLNETFIVSHSSDSCDIVSTASDFRSSLLCGAASKLESLLPITIEERIARYKDAFLGDENESEYKLNETRINVILPRPSKSEIKNTEELSVCKSNKLTCFNPDLKTSESCDILSYNSNANKSESDEENCNVTSVKIISHNTYPLSSAIHKILSSNIDSKYLEQKLDYQIVNILDVDKTSLSDSDLKSEISIEKDTEDSKPSMIAPLPKVMNPKEKASSENDLLVANYRTETKVSKVVGTKSVGNISELENTNNKNGFRDTGYYSFKSSEDSFLSLDDSTSQTSSASLTKHRSLTSTETIPEEEESCSTHKGVTTAKMSLSSSNIPDAVCDASSSKSSTLPLSLRSKLSVTPGGNHRSRSSFFSTSGVLRKLTLLRDESGNSLRSSPHGRLRMRNRSLSGGSEDGKQKKTSVPQISVSECLENPVGRLSAASSEKDSSGVQEDEIDQAFAYHCRSQMSLSSFGGRSESVTSVYSAAGGGRYGTVTVTGEVLFGLSYNYKTSTLEINIKECRNLAAVDMKRNRSDPYVKVYLLPDRTKSGKRKTKVKKHTLNPVFEESLKFHVTINELVIRTLWLSVWHSDRFGRNDFLGEVMLPLGSDVIESSGSKWYPLQERLETLDTPVSYKGDLILALKYVPPDVTSRKFSKKLDVPVKGSLEVLVREARNLMATRSNGTSDPFCKSYLLPDKSKSGKQKTPVFKKSCNPKWNHTFVYEDVSLEDLKERCLELTIWDYDKITSNDFLGGVRLCLGTGKCQGREVDWMDSVGEERSLWYTMLERPNTWVDGSLLLRPNMQNRRGT
ncbi:synaptotagmin-like protein 4 [Nephila pilipes]|uniref:Synaptotagmin-like protein 4 n=1 Tax=Nephila pilipes TaxID=299642 RepID=A0A8X6P8B5_NEPPI|nr:synaptotagmin-like protein 4 [Nephila pilipes]